MHRAPASPHAYPRFQDRLLHAVEVVLDGSAPPPTNPKGFAPPRIKYFKAHIDLTPGAIAKLRQPYRLSKFDETRLMYLYGEAEAEGKVTRYALGDKPPVVCTPVFVVDKRVH